MNQICSDKYMNAWPQVTNCSSSYAELSVKSRKDQLTPLLLVTGSKLVISTDKQAKKFMSLGFHSFTWLISTWLSWTLTAWGSGHAINDYVTLCASLLRRSLGKTSLREGLHYKDMSDKVTARVSPVHTTGLCLPRVRLIDVNHIAKS